MKTAVIHTIWSREETTPRSQSKTAVIHAIGWEVITHYNPINLHRIMSGSLKLLICIPWFRYWSCDSDNLVWYRPMDEHKLCHTSIIIYAKLDHGIRKWIHIVFIEKHVGDRFLPVNCRCNSDRHFISSESEFCQDYNQLETQTISLWLWEIWIKYCNRTESFALPESDKLC
jgi:hypothetical protein